MKLRVVTEDVEPNHWIAWVLDLPGCYSAAPTEESALALCPRRISAYFDWIAAHDESMAIRTIDFSTILTERFRSYYAADAPEYYVNAFFQGEEQPLSYWEVVDYRRLLEWSHQELLQVAEPVLRAGTALAPTLVQSEIRSLLGHVAGAENWYFSHLGFELADAHLTADPLERLIAVRANSLARFTHLVGDDRVVEYHEEKWSARKILRRALWHERDHLEQIRALLEEWV